MTGRATILRGDALHLPLADDTVDLIVTSPPYFGIRSYQDGGKHYDGQLGSEATPAEFVDALLAATAEMVRVLKPSGSLWVNLGDRYSSGSSGQSNLTKLGERLGSGGGQKQDRARQGTSAAAGFPPKTLLGIPWRYALACIGGGPVIDAQFARALVRDVAQGWLSLVEAETLLDEAQAMTDPGLGLILRAEIIWSKPNGLPESTTDRVRRSHEQWFHLVKQPRYFSAVDEIRESQTGGSHSGRRDGQPPPGGKIDRMIANGDHGGNYGSTNPAMFNPLGKLPGSVWSIPTQPLTVPAHLGVDHFAAFPMEWPRRIIQGWSPRGVCTACGEGRRPVTEVQPQPGLDGELLETRRREPSDEQARQIADFIRAHREGKGMTRRDVDDACGTNTSCSWWEGRAGIVQLPGPVLWRRLSKVLDLPQTWDHLMLDTYMRPTGKLTSGPAAVSGRHQTAGSTGLRSSAIITGYICACPHPTAPTTPAMILDPFGGTGTVALVAKALGRHGISLDMSADYCRLAGWRTTDEGELARALQVDKPTPQVDGQLSLLEGLFT